MSGLMSAAQPGRRSNISACRFEKALAYESAVCIEKTLPAGIFSRNRHTSAAFIGAAADLDTAADQPATLLALKVGRGHSELTGEGSWIHNPRAVWVAFKSHGVPSFSLDSFGGLRCTVTHSRRRQGKTCCCAIAALQLGTLGTKPIRVVGELSTFPEAGVTKQRFQSLTYGDEAEQQRPLSAPSQLPWCRRVVG